MKYLSLVFHFLLMSIPMMLHGQDCIGTVHLDEQPVCVTDILTLEQPIELTRLADSLSERGDIALVNKYYHTTSYSAYKNIYKSSDWYNLPESEYKTWMAYMKGKPIQVESVIMFIDNNITYSCMQFYTISNSCYDRVTFLSKKIGNLWYPSSEKEEETFAYQKGFFRSIRPQLLDYFFQEKESATVRSSQKIAHLKEKVMDGKDLDARALLMDRKAVTSYQSEDYKNLYFNLSERLDAESWYNADRQNDTLLIHYMDSLQVPAPLQEEIVVAIKNLRYLEAAALITKFQGVPSNIPVHTTAIRRIYGQDRLIEIVAKSEHE